MNGAQQKFKDLSALSASAVIDMSITIYRIILLAHCNLTLAFIVLILEKGDDQLKKLSRSIVVITLPAIIATAG
jgi:hypothetical protein